MGKPLADWWWEPWGTSGVTEQGTEVQIGKRIRYPG